MSSKEERFASYQSMPFIMIPNPEPDKFRPERSAPEAIPKRDALKWLPFGDGPRNCIGLRFAMMQIRLSLATLLENFEFSTTDKTIVPITFVPQNFMMAPNGGDYLNVRNLKCSNSCTHLFKYQKHFPIPSHHKFWIWSSCGVTLRTSST